MLAARCRIFSLVLFGDSSSLFDDMKSSWLVLATCVVVVAAEILPATDAVPYFDDGKFFYKFPALK